MKIAFLFPGQGVQHVGMGKDLYDNFEIVKKFYDNVANIRDLSFNGPDEDLSQTKNTQPCLVALQVVICKLLQIHGIKADVVAGLSLGEYSALSYAGYLSEDEAISLVTKRGEIMQNSIAQGIGTMAAVLGLEDDVLNNICSEVTSNNEIVEIANFNCPGQRVLSGHIGAVQKASKLASEKGARKVISLNVAGPFHTSLYKQASNQLLSELQKVQISTPTIQMFFNVLGDVNNSNIPIINLMQQQIYSPIFFESIINNMLKNEIETFIEVGPGKTLGSFVKKVSRTVKVYNVEDLESLNKVTKELS